MEKVLDSATAAFIIEILAKHASRHVKSVLCDKDPFNLKQTIYLKALFPKAKFLLMIRDGRATAHSIITRKVTISGFDITSYRDVLTKWNRAISEMWKQCEEVGPDSCMPVWYEQLVLQPNRTIHNIVSFLGIPWENTMLHHQDVVGKNISLSKVERSTDQVAKPVNLDGLTSWVGHVPSDVLRDLQIIAPMLVKLGYDIHSRSPKYGEPDAIVRKNLKLLKEHPENYKVDTFRIDVNGQIQKGQPGQSEMDAKAANAPHNRINFQEP
ncbi:protein-tyrosine sulfotransferase 2-like [Convolutriloba macropyga]|uniref:protein-tyrosine sulfotransferase 2-like n=1 Tax=Convolutriloba macropyga TaxID=536237 RepID=UPI003F51EA96